MLHAKTVEVPGLANCFTHLYHDTRRDIGSLNKFFDCQLKEMPKLIAYRRNLKDAAVADEPEEDIEAKNLLKAKREQ